MKTTDWTNYYKQKKSIFSKFTQKFTLNIIEEMIRKFQNCENLNILELGGGNSCFVEALCQNINICRYDIIDNNQLAVDLFNEIKLPNVSLRGMKRNLLDLSVDEDIEQYDFVYSVGLIEHFQGSELYTVIKKHFKYCKDDGFVLISFPTPTLKYRICRKLMEWFGVWQFWDECPLRYEDVKDELESQGKIKVVKLNKRLPLSQLVIVIQKECK